MDWKDYKQKIKTQINIPDDKELLTEKQWAKKHFVKKNESCGKKLWSNGNCQVHSLYLWDDEVRPMTSDELEKVRAEAKAKREAKAEKKLKQLKKQIYREAISDIINNSFSKVTDSTHKHELIVIDTETTGLTPYEDELLQVSIIDGEGNTLFDEYIKPLFYDSWDGAMKVNGITPEMVSDKPSILEYKQELVNIINSADKIVGYNTQFDLAFLSSVGIENEKAEVVDVMLDFAEVYGEWSENYGCYKCQKLTTCAEYYNYDWGEDNAHNSLSDCRATLFCYQQIQKNANANK